MIIACYFAGPLFTNSTLFFPLIVIVCGAKMRMLSPTHDISEEFAHITSSLCFGTFNIKTSFYATRICLAPCICLISQRVLFTLGYFAHAQPHPPLSNCKFKAHNLTLVLVRIKTSFYATHKVGVKSLP